MVINDFILDHDPAWTTFGIVGIYLLITTGFGFIQSRKIDSGGLISKNPFGIPNIIISFIIPLIILLIDSSLFSQHEIPIVTKD